MLRILMLVTVLCFSVIFPELLPAQGIDVTPHSQLVGTEYSESFGWSVASAGDVDDDGVLDFIIGSPDSDGGPGLDAGRVTVVSGADGSLLYVIDGESDGDRFGYAVCGIGDFDSNSQDDFVCGSPNSNAGGTGLDVGRVYGIQSGTNAYQFYDGPSDNSRFGESASAAGDVNGDGYADAIIGASGADSAYVISGLDFAVLYAFTGTAGSEFGVSVGGAGDVNSDGFDDVIVGAPSDDNAASNAGAAMVYSGFSGALLYTFEGEENDELGRAVGGAGDVNGDGAEDILIGIPLREEARIYSGETGALVHSIEVAEAGFGISLSGIGDADGDGSSDVIIGSEARFVGIYSGFTGLSLATFTAPAPSDLGASVSGLGDLDGDGFPEIIIGDPGYTDNQAVGSDMGMVLVYSLSPAIAPVENFRRGDANQDGGFNIADQIYLLAALFSGGAVCECPDACDQNDDGGVNIADAIYGLAALFSGGTPTPDPGPTNCGGDPTDDALSECIYNSSC
ncbi:MAG: hypothetical protein VX764_04095 [Planctomycetota bacterium]|nr:hypothetical protein [Planctomycetota bacterium]